MTRTLPILLVFAAACGAPPPRADRETAWRATVRSTLLIPAPLPALEPRFHGRFVPDPGIVAERVTYATQFGLRVPAILYRPARSAGRAPGVVIVNGHGGDKYSWYAFYSGILYARAGGVVLTYDAIGEGERNARRASGTRDHDKVKGPPELARRLCGLLVTDAMQAVSYLRSRPEVDADRIAVCGYSLGSFVVAIAGAVDPRIRACVMAGGGNLDGPGGYWDHTKPMCTGRPYQALQILGDRPAVIYALHAARGPALVFNGTKDGTVGIRGDQEEIFRDVRSRVAALRGTEEGVFESGWWPDVGHRPWFVTKPVALWLERAVDFPEWSEAGIRGMPETHVSEWAKARGVAMDPLYADEFQEGGAQALGEGVPGLSRGELSVLAPDAWEREKGRLILEAWLGEVAAIGLSGR